MADDTTTQDLNAIVQAIGFGIVSDFRELRQAMYGISAEMDESNRLLGSVNQNLEYTGRSLDQLEKDIYRQIDSRQFKQLENQIESKNRQSIRRNDEIMRSVLSAVNDIKRQAGSVRMQIDAAGNVTQTQSDGSAPPGGSTSGGSYLGAAITAVAGVAALGVAAYMMSGSGAASDSSGAQPPSTPPPTPPMAPPLPTSNRQGPTFSGTSMAPPPSAPAAARSPASVQTPNLSSSSPPSTNFNLNSATQVVSAITTTAKSKALAKVQTKAPNWFSRNGGRIEDTIGAQYVTTFGKMIGGRFSFNRFMSDDSWTNLGLAYISGQQLPDTGKGDPNLTYVAQVVVNLGIQAYLIAREIYTDENAQDITSNVVPNFDEVEESLRKQVVKNVGSYLETYVNFLIDRASSKGSAVPAATTAPAPDSGGPGGSLAPPAATDSSGGGPVGSSNPQASPGGPSGSQAPQSYGGGGTQQGQSQSFSPTGEPGAQASSPATQVGDTGGGYQAPAASDAQSTPIDNMASFSTSQNVASSATGDYGPLLDYIASSEGADYNTQFGNQHTAGGKALTDMTIAEVMQTQSKQRGSSAIGRYQFMKQTMRDLIAAGVISSDDQFSPATQDTMASYLIDKKRNGAAWKAGKISDAQFGKGLSQEWASVPDPATGRGTYSGQRAKYGTDVLMSTLKTVKTPAAGPSDAKTAVPPAAAAGALITPLPSDAMSSNMSRALAPSPAEMRMTRGADSSSEEETSSSSISPIDARSRSQRANPYDEAKNKIAYYHYLMGHHFGHLKEDMKQAHEEVTSDEYHFGRALDPLA